MKVKQNVCRYRKESTALTAAALTDPSGGVFQQGDEEAKEEGGEADSQSAMTESAPSPPPAPAPLDVLDSDLNLTLEPPPPTPKEVLQEIDLTPFVRSVCRETVGQLSNFLLNCQSSLTVPYCFSLLFSFYV